MESRAPARSGGGGRSQGANAQRKRANRDGQQPRTDRSGRPTRSGEGRPARSNDGRPARSGEGRPTANTGGGRAAVTGERRSSEQRTARTESAPSRPRGGKGRAQSPAGPIRVGQVVRGNSRSNGR